MGRDELTTLVGGQLLPHGFGRLPPLPCLGGEVTELASFEESCDGFGFQCGHGETSVNVLDRGP